MMMTRRTDYSTNRLSMFTHVRGHRTRGVSLQTQCNESLCSRHATTSVPIELNSQQFWWRLLAWVRHAWRRLIGGAGCKYGGPPSSDVLQWQALYAQQCHKHNALSMHQTAQARGGRGLALYSPKLPTRLVAWQSPIPNSPFYSTLV